MRADRCADAALLYHRIGDTECVLPLTEGYREVGFLVEVVVVDSAPFDAEGAIGGCASHSGIDAAATYVAYAAWRSCCPQVVPVCEDGVLEACCGQGSVDVSRVAGTELQVAVGTHPCAGERRGRLPVEYDGERQNDISHTVVAVITYVNVAWADAALRSRNRIPGGCACSRRCKCRCRCARWRVGRSAGGGAGGGSGSNWCRRPAKLLITLIVGKLQAVGEAAGRIALEL